MKKSLTFLVLLIFSCNLSKQIKDINYSSGILSSLKFNYSDEDESFLDPSIASQERRKFERGLNESEKRGIINLIALKNLTGSQKIQSVLLEEAKIYKKILKYVERDAKIVKDKLYLESTNNYKKILSNIERKLREDIPQNQNKIQAFNAFFAHSPRNSQMKYLEVFNSINFENLKERADSLNFVKVEFKKIISEIKHNLEVGFAYLVVKKHFNGHFVQDKWDLIIAVARDLLNNNPSLKSSFETLEKSI